MSHSVPQYSLHRAVLNHDVDGILKLLSDHPEIDLDERDASGIPAIHYAIYLGYRDIIRILLDKGADATKRSLAGWSAVQESIATANRAIMADVISTVSRRVNVQYQKKMPVLVSALRKIPDFYMELKWEFHSWVPLVSRLCPYDAYKIYKGDACFRVDTTLIGFENMKWIRGDISFLFKGDESGGELLVLDHQKKTVDRAFTSNTNCVDYAMHPDSISPAELDDLMHHDLIRTFPVTDKVEFSQSKTWMGYEKRERVGEWNARVYDVSGFEMRILNRKRDKKKPVEVGHVTEQKRKELLESCSRPSGDGEHGLLHPSETVTEKNKSFKGTMWISEDFPRTINELLPIFEALAPTNRHFEKLNQFISLKMPSVGFPVKLEIPVFPTVSGVVTFLEHEERPIDESLFEIPPDYVYIDAKKRAQMHQSRQAAAARNNDDVTTGDSECSVKSEDLERLLKSEEHELNGAEQDTVGVRV